jgi:hypothetical protein
MREMIQKKSPIDRLKMGWSMYETSKKLIIQAILKNNPSISTTKLRQEIFLRFYSNDFDAEQREKIIQYLGQV